MDIHAATYNRLENARRPEHRLKPAGSVVRYVVLCIVCHCAVWTWPIRRRICRFGVVCRSIRVSDRADAYK